MKLRNNLHCILQNNSLSSWLYAFNALCLLLIFSISAFAQEKQMVEIKTFDQHLQPYKNISISINGGAYISTGNEGVIFSEIRADDLPVRSINIKNQQLEAASWNHSKGTLEIIVRKKSYQLIHVYVIDKQNKNLAGAKVIFKGRKTITTTTNAEGYFELPLALDDKIKSADQFFVSDHNVVKLDLIGGKNVLTVDQVRNNVVVPVEEEEEVTSSSNRTPVKAPGGYFKDFDLTKLDSIQSLTVFYAIFKDYDRKNLSDEKRREVDQKFNELVGQLQDSLQHDQLAFIDRISDSTIVKDDIRNLLAQARLERQMLIMQQSDVEQKIKVINDKLAAGFENLDAEARTALLSDLTLLEQILTENENRFYKNQNSYRQIISSLKERFFDLENLENKLSASEAQRMEEQRIFRQRLMATLSIVAVFAILIILLIYFSNKLKKQKQQLILANDEIKRVNENLEGLVFERTKLLIETNRELDTVLYRASHDLRSPVRSIIGLCNIATSLSNGETNEVLERVIQTTVEMDKLLKKLSIISEINEPSNFSPVTLTEIVENIQNDFNPIIQDHKIDFIIDCPDDLVINTYPNLIEVILVNLIENALFYCMLKNAGNSQVQFTATMKDQHLEMILMDNGIGVDKTISDKLFDMFFKGHERSKGNGLGLYIVQKSVHALKGKIVVESEPGQFARFLVDLPMQDLKEGVVTS